MKKPILAIAMATAAALALAACGAENTESSSASTTSAAPSTSTVAAAPATSSAAPSSMAATEQSDVSDQEVLDAVSEGRGGAAAFQSDLTAIGITAGEQITLTMWAQAACTMSSQMGLSDTQVAGYLPGDVASDVTLTPGQATAVWASAKKNIC